MPSYLIYITWLRCSYDHAIYVYIYLSISSNVYEFTLTCKIYESNQINIVN